MSSFPPLAESARLRYATFFYLYFMQGIPSGFALTALANYLIGRGLPAAAVGSFVSIVGLPWILQLVWGPFIDRYRYSVVGHYKHWIVLTQWAAAGASLVLLVVQDPAVQTGLLGTLFFAHSVVASVQDASVDAMAILITPERERGRVNAFMRGGLLLGISFGAAALSVVLHRYGFRVAVGVQSALLVIFSLLFFVTKLHRTDPLLPRFGRPATGGSRAEERSLRHLFSQLGAALINPLSLRIFGVIGLSYLSFAVFIRSLNFYLIRTLHWSDQDLSVLTGGWGSLTTLAVVFAGGYLADRLGPIRLQIRVLLVLAFFLIGFNVLLFTMTNRTLITAGLLFWGIADPLYSIAAFPILMTLCRKEIAGSQFTAYMALINLSDIGGAYASGWLLEVVPGPLLGLSAGLVLLILLGWLARLQNKEEAV
ncbi:MFS transporter [Larkinella sp. GY13]|uniref:MFS transporter n=1 Tax=Larkinella sp. GY13 TaxID=3453720 RepID=UPI003EEF1B4C